MPENLDAEAVVLGAMILNGDCIPQVARMLGPDDFFRLEHGSIYRLLLSMYDAGTPVSLAAVAVEFRKGQCADIEGGIDYVDGLVNGVPSAVDWQYYAKCVQDAGRRRQIIQLCQKAADCARDEKYSVDSLIDRFQQRAYEIGLRGRGGRTDSVSAASAMQSALDHAERVKAGLEKPGLTLGFERQDAVIGGIQPTDLVVLGAAPGAGKTSFAMAFAAWTMAKGKSVVIVSREMATRELGKRCLQVLAEVDGDTIKHGRHTDDELNRMAGYVESAKSWHGHIDASCRTVSEVVALCRQQARVWKRPVDLVVVDYLQLMQGAGDSRAQEVGGITYGLKDMAMDLGCSVMLLSQFDRHTNRNELVPPSIYSFKESGDIESAANTAILLWRHPATPLVDGIGTVWVKVAKQREGMTTPWPRTSQQPNVMPDGSNGALWLSWVPAQTRFYELPNI